MSNTNYVSQRRLSLFLNKILNMFITRKEYNNDITHYDNRHTCNYNPTEHDFSKNYALLCGEITSPEDIIGSEFTAVYNEETFKFSPELTSDFSWLEEYKCYFCSFKSPLNFDISNPGEIVEIQCLIFPEPYMSITEPGMYITKDALYNYALVNSSIEFSVGELKKLDEKFIPSIFIKEQQKGTINGVASLDENGKVPLCQLPDEYITETELNNKGYLTTVPDEYVTSTELNSAIEAFDAAIADIIGSGVLA